MPTSPALSFKNVNRKSVGYYILTALAVGILSNLIGLEEMLSDFLSPGTLAVVMTVITIILKKFIEKK